MADSTPPPVEVTEDREKTRRIIVRLAFVQFNGFVFACLLAMVFKGWEVSPATSNFMTMVLQSEIALVSAVGGFYLAISSGQAKTTPDKIDATTQPPIETPPPKA